MTSATQRSDRLPGDVLEAPDFAITHSTVVNASAEEVYRCLRQIRLADLPLAGVLFAIRRAPALILGKTPVAFTPDKGWVEAMLDEGFVLLRDRPPRELVLGVVGRFWELASGVVRVDAAGFDAFAGPGCAKAVVSWRIVPLGGGQCEVVTETRVRAVDGSARWRFRAYWTLIRCGSALIRREMLSVLRRRAEGRAGG